MTQGKIELIADGRRCFIDGKEITPDLSWAIRNHSPDGFMWGYGGSGPAQLALAIMLELHPDGARQMYQDFKNEFLAGLDIDKDAEIEISKVHEWIKKERGI